MKKKILLAFLTLFVAFVAVINVNAKTAKAPSAVPDEGDTLYGLLDDSFDFSKITFSNADGTGTIPGKSDMKKIMLTANPVMTGTTEDDVLGDSWFTVYCLDGNLKFPMFNIFDFALYDATDTDAALAYSVMFALFNEIDLHDAFLKVVDSSFTPDVSGIKYDLPDGTTSAELLSNLQSGQEITVNVTELVYDSTTNLNVTAADFSKDTTAVTYPFTFSKEDIMMSKYTAKALSTKNYNHALWIIEHSYPTLDIVSSLKLADADYDSLVTEITGLHTEATSEEITELLENYVYATVQYAIWKVNGYVYNGTDTLGDTLNGSIELNKLYQYLIKDRNEYENYSSLEFGEKLNLVQPKEDKLIAEETKESYTYGPYSVTADFLSVGDINVSISNEVKNKVDNNTNTSKDQNVSTPSASISNNDNIVAMGSDDVVKASQMTSASNACSIIDKSGNALTIIAPNQEFYVKCNKSANIANVTINVKSAGALTFYPTSNRGRIYYSHYAAAQNVISGGKIVTNDINLDFDLIFNPKTGVENIAILFVISLIAFSLGYLVLSYKNKPVELN